jgi:tetratricopeptide (TPR) repeat protein
MDPVSSGETTSGRVPPHLSPGPGEPFVGRARELARVCAAGDALAGGRGHLLVVSGEAGVGKSRFCDEVAVRSRAAEARVVEARCWLDGGAPPLWPWHPILDELTGGSGGHLLHAGADVGAVGHDRFARFVAVTDCLAAACAESPLVLVIDDVQGADYGALLLIRFVARSLARFPLLLVLGRRHDEPEGASDEARLLDEIEGEATTITLGGFDRDETEAFLAASGIDTGADTGGSGLVTALLALTRGHPLHLRRIVQTMRTSATTPALGGGLRRAIQQAFEPLPDGQRRVLSCAAVLGPDPAVAETAEVAGCDPVAVLDAARAGVAAGLVSTVGDGAFSFSHELVRAAIEDDLSPTDRFDAHARAATVIATGEGAGRKAHRLARAAHHARAAAARSADDAHQAVTLCEAAAQAMVRNYAYEQGDELFGAAVELHTSGLLGQPSALLTLQWAQAAALRGHLNAARERYAVAITRSQVEGRPALLVESVLGWAGVWLDDYPSKAEKARMLNLYRRALDGLPVDDPDYEHLRCRMRARLAAESTYDGGPVDELLDAVEKTRATGDRRALAEVLSLAQHALFTQEHLHARLPLNDELLRITDETDQGTLTLVGLVWRTVNLLHLGDPQFIRALEVLREQAVTLGNQHILYNVGVFDVLVAIGQGRLDEAEERATRCYELGERIGRVDAFVYYAAQLATMRWLQGRDAEMLEHIGAVTTSPVVADTEFSVWALAACLAARAGDLDQARTVLRHYLPERLADLAPSGTWMAGMVALVEAIAVLGDEGLAAQAYDLLAPHAGLPAVAGLGIVCLGSVERSLGLAAGVLGQHDRAVAHLERAVTANQRIVNQVVLALSRAELAAALIRRPDKRPDDCHRAEQLLAQAVDDGRAFGLTGRVAGWERELAALRDVAGVAGAAGAGIGVDVGVGVRVASFPAAPAPVPPPPPATPAPADQNGAKRGTIQRDGKRWVLTLDGRRIRVPNLVGVRYLAELLTNPGQRIPAVALTGQLADPAQPHRQEVLDEQARSTYAARARELAADLAEAEATNDLHRAERLRAEIDLLVDQIEMATGLGGRPRHFPDDHERARVAVQKAIKRALDAVEDADLALSETLRQTITTGVTCTYTPSRKAPVTWYAHDERSAV